MGQPPKVNAKCDVVMKLSVFGTRTDTHTRKAKPIHPRYAGCNSKSTATNPYRDHGSPNRNISKKHVDITVTKLTIVVKKKEM